MFTTMLRKTKINIVTLTYSLEKKDKCRMDIKVVDFVLGLKKNIVDQNNFENATS